MYSPVRQQKTAYFLRKNPFTDGKRFCIMFDGNYAAQLIRSCGLLRRENAGMSSEMEVGILQAEYPRFPE